VEIINCVSWYIGRCVEWEGAEVNSIEVDLKMFANFIGRVKSTSVFCTCVGRSSFKALSGKRRVALDPTQKNWALLNEDDSPERSVTQMLHELSRKQAVAQVVSMPIEGSLLPRDEEDARSRDWHREVCYL